VPQNRPRGAPLRPSSSSNAKDQPTSGSSGRIVGGTAFASVAGNSPAASARRSATPLGTCDTTMRHWTLALRVSLVVVLVLGISCSEAERRCECVPLMPLAVGNSWVYRLCIVSQPGGEPNCYGLSLVALTGIGELAGDDYYLARGQAAMAFRETCDGLSVVGHDGLTVVAYEYFFRYPVTDGATYRYVSTKVSFPTMTYRVEKEVVTVPAGKYWVYTYHISAGSGMPEETMSFAPGVGLVRRTHPSGDAIIIEELLPSELGSPATQSASEGNAVCDP
jgi:hypothetical protein